MWEKLKLPFFCERMVAFSIPQGDALWVMTWDELFHIILASEVSISRVLQSEKELDEVFDEHRSILTINGQTYSMLGLYGGVPILSNASGERLFLDSCQDRLIVLNSDQQVKQIIKFSDSSGDWRWATFSADYNHLVIGVPYDLFIYQ